jgi:spermidine/putrescine-binding protein
MLLLLDKDTWKAISGVRQPEQQPITTEVKENRSKSLKAASVDTGTSPISSQKKYSRKAIQELLKNNPDKYYAHSEEILQAYAEGRVYN